MKVGTDENADSANFSLFKIKAINCTYSLQTNLGINTALTTLKIDCTTLLLQQLDVTYRCYGNYPL